MTLVETISTFASAAVAGVAIWASNQQSKRTLGLSARQLRIEEAKVRSELFDRRYAAWLDLRRFSESRYLAIIGMKPTDSAEDVISPEDRIGFQEAAERLFFLFGDDVFQAVNRLDGLLVAFHVATVRERTASGGRQAQVLLQGETLAANQACYEALNGLKILIKGYMQPAV
jgi:hypothetical protein